MSALTAGFATPVLSAQTTFRAVLSALARPGSVHPIGAVVAAPAPLSAGMAAVALSLCDHDTPMWLDAGLRARDDVVTWLRFHCGSPIVDEPRAAAFALVSEPSELPAFDRFDLGTADYPDQSTTIVLQLDTLRSGSDLLLTGPGIQHRQSLRAAPLPEDIRARLIANRSLFPRGVDLILVAAGEVAGLPRSVRVVSEEH
jgi:alpha-D-ribose 1-methylphosphonate 5-triphosphate synthase subunit PhnH